MYLLILIVPTVVLAYYLGSVNGAIIVSKLFFRKDIREYGSGNAGLTNTYRTFGAKAAIPVFLVDVIKTVVPVLVGGWLFTKIPYLPDNWQLPTGLTKLTGQLLAGLAVMLGHCFPLYHKFKGGKGVMAIGVIIIIADWRIALIGWGIFIVLTALTRYVSLGSIVGSTALPVSMALIYDGGMTELVLMVLCVLLLVIRHAENVKRILKGEERKLKSRS